MQININTLVAADLPSVWRKFDQELFEALAPPFPFLKILLFEGCETGNCVSLELNFIFFKQTWNSLITEQKTMETAIYFIDEGEKLPFPLTYWHHKHLLEKSKNGTWIKDQITYRTPYLWLDYLVFPFLYAQFWYRKPIYRKYFHL